MQIKNKNIISMIKFSWPVQMFMQELKCSFTAHRMPTIKIFYFCVVPFVELIIEKSDLTEFIAYPCIGLYQVMMTTFNHKWPWKNKICHLSIAESISHIK